MPDDLNPKMRAYLAEVYRLSDPADVPSADQPEAFVSTSALADLLGVSAPAVNRMVNRLKELNMLIHEPYQGIRLTEQGRVEALKQVRRQRIAEAFLTRVMGFDWSVIHAEAQTMSQALSEPLLQRMAEMAEQPTHCPHGEPIPDADGHIELPQDHLLCDIEGGHRVRITRMRTRETDRLQYIEALGLLPGKEVDVLHVAPFNGPMQLKVGEEYRIIGYNLAQLIRAEIVATL